MCVFFPCFVDIPFQDTVKSTTRPSPPTMSRIAIALLTLLAGARAHVAGCGVCTVSETCNTNIFDGCPGTGGVWNESSGVLPTILSWHIHIMYGSSPTQRAAMIDARRVQSRAGALGAPPNSVRGHRDLSACTRPSLWMKPLPRPSPTHQVQRGCLQRAIRPRPRPSRRARTRGGLSGR